MESGKEKMKNMGSVAKEHVDIYETKLEEKAQKTVLKTKEEKKIAHELAKAKEHEAKRDLHEAKARHAAETLHAKQAKATYDYHRAAAAAAAAAATDYDQLPVNTAPSQQPPAAINPTTGTTVPTYPLGGLPHSYKHR